MDWQSVQPFFTWLSDHPALAGLVVLLIALTESLIIVGLIVPGAVLMFGVGTLVGTGVLGFKETIILAFVGAVLGDGISFWVGKHYNEQLSRFWPFNKKPEYLELGRAFFIKHGGKSIFFGRFVGPVRPIIPAVAGMMGMSSRYFLAMNILSAMLWAPFYLIPGIVFGKSIALAEVVGGRLMVILVTIVVLFVLLFWIARKFMLIILPQAESVFTTGFNWAAKHPHLGRPLLAIFSPHVSMRRALITSSSLIFLSLLALYLLVLQLFNPAQLGVDEFVLNFSQLAQSPSRNSFFHLLSVWLSWPVVGSALFVSGLILLAIKKGVVFRYFFFSMAASLLTAVTFLGLAGVHESQLRDLLALTVATSFFGCFAILLFSKFSFVIRWVVYSLFIILLTLPVVSLFYFSRALPSDVVMVIATSLLWVGFVSLIFQKQLLEFERQTLFGVVIVATFFSAGLITVVVSEPEMYETKAGVEEMNLVDWQASDWRKFASYRKDIFGEEKQRLNIQWLGELQAIEQTLIDVGWGKPVDLSTQAILYYLKPEPSFTELPLIPQSHMGRQEALVLYKETEDVNVRHVLQLWRSGYSVSGKPMWVGSVTTRTLSIQKIWVRFPQISLDESFSAKLLQLQSSWRVDKRKRASGQNLYLVSH